MLGNLLVRGCLRLRYNRGEREKSHSKDTGDRHTRLL